MQNTHSAAQNDQLFAFATALYRFGSLLSDRPMAEILKESALALTTAAAKGDNAEAAKTLASIKRLMELAGSTRILRAEDATVIGTHAGKFQEALAESEAMQPFEGLFTHQLPAKPAEVSVRVPQPPRQQPVQQKQIVAPKPPQRQVSGNINSGNTVRKDEIVKVVVRKGSARMKDVQESLPNVSERTLRYDIEELIKSGRIERVGSSGPATFYRIPGVTTDTPAISRSL